LNASLKIKEHEDVTVKDFSPDYQDIGTLKDSHTDLNSFQVKTELLEKEWDSAAKYQFPQSGHL
jgi:hypothetical protein